jgi:hypothetical protein
MTFMGGYDCDFSTTIPELYPILCPTAKSLTTDGVLWCSTAQKQYLSVLILDDVTRKHLTKEPWTQD